MGDVAWLTGLLTAAGGLVAWLVRWIVKRERERVREEIERERQISAEWRQVAETEQANSRRTNEILGQMNQAMARIMMTLERPPWVATAPSVGVDGSRGSDTSRHRRSESPWLP